jgi:HlyD family secretion protein
MYRKQLLIPFVVLLAVGLSGCGKQSATVTTNLQTGPVPVKVASVVPGTLSNRAVFTGTLAPNQVVKLAPKISAKLLSVYVKVGDYVNKGDMLFKLDSTDLQNAVNSAQAAYQSALASYANAQISHQAQLLQAQNNLEKTQQALSDAERNEQRAESLYQAGGYSSQQLEQAQTNLKNAQIDFENAKNALTNLQKGADLDAAKSSVDQAKVNLQNAQSQLDNVVVVSPISGYVSAVNGDVGEMASPQSPVVTVVDTSSLKVVINLSQDDVVTTHVGDPVTIEVPSINKTFHSVIKTISPTMDANVKAYPVEISISNSNNELKSDMIVDVTLQNAKHQTANTYLIPQKAVLEEQGKKYVFKLVGNTVKKVEISTGEEDSDQVEVKSGLAEKDQVVIQGYSLLNDGSKVSVQ